MFNYRGDPNGRHNLPGEPMLDNLLGALFVLGVGLCLLRFWRPRALLLLIWLFVMLMGGVLSLGFEAPQSLRAIGTQPASYLLAMVPLHALWVAWRNSGGARHSAFIAVPLIALLLGIGYNNFYTYFYRQAENFPSWNAFSTPETLAAQILQETDEETEVYIISYFHGHPTLNFLVTNNHPYRRLETTDHLPLDWPADKNVVLIANADSRNLFEEAKRYYPNAVYEEYRAPGNGPTVLYYVHLTQADIAAVQGLTARYYGSDDWSGAPLIEGRENTLQFEWPAQAPLPLPFSAEWEGVLNVKVYGTHQFFVQSPGQTLLYIDESAILNGTGELSTAVVLAEGKHTIRVRATGGEGPFSLAWRPPDRGPEIVPASALFVPPVTSNGLLGRYYPNGNWQGPEALARIDPLLNLYFHITPLIRPYTVEWTGKIAIPQNGSYRFGLEAIDDAVLWIDEQEVTASLLPNQYQEGTLDLSEGLHDIRIRYADRTDHTHINLY
ncbi:MAG: PA14 domain-containing protein [Caldilineaceae bacterium]